MERIAPIGPAGDPAATTRGAPPPDEEQTETAYRVTFTLVLDKPADAGQGGDS
jgi:hypothetical protein